MKRIEIEKPGGLDNLKFVDAEKPKPLSDEVLLKVSHSSLNYHDLLVAIGFIPTEDKILFNKPLIFSKPIAKIKKGRVLVLLDCENNWCKVKSNKFKGWIKTDNIWGKTK